MNYSITTCKTGTTRTTTSRTTSTTPMTTLTQCTCSSTVACRTSSESARIAHCSTAVDDHIAHLLAQVLSAFHFHPWSSTWRTLFDSTLSAFYFFLFLLFVPVFLFHLELFPELLYTKDMANLRHSATNESEDTSDVFITTT